MSPPRRRSSEELRPVSPIVEESEPIVVQTTPDEESSKRRSKELKVGIELRNPFKKKQVRIVDKRPDSSSRHGDSDAETVDLRRRQPHARQSPPLMSGAGSHHDSPIRPVQAPSPPSPSLAGEPRVEYVLPRDEESFEYGRRFTVPRRQTSRSYGSSSPRSGSGEERVFIDSDHDETVDRLEAETRRARRSASRERRLRREAQLRAYRAEAEAAVEKDRRREAERRSRKAEIEIDLAEERRILARREADRARERSQERRVLARREVERARERSQERMRRLLDRQRELLLGDRRRDELLSNRLADLDLLGPRRSPERAEDLRRDRGDPGSRLILEAQDSLRREREREIDRELRNRGPGRIIMDDDDFRSGPRYR